MHRSSASNVQTGTRAKFNGEAEETVSEAVRQHNFGERSRTLSWPTAISTRSVLDRRFLLRILAVQELALKSLSRGNKDRARPLTRDEVSGNWCRYPSWRFGGEVKNVTVLDQT